MRCKLSIAPAAYTLSPDRLLVAVSHEDVRHIAALARLGLEPDRVTLLVGELNGILAHMDA